jgi:hypothetical protein
VNRIRAAAGGALALVLGGAPAMAQTDYRNLDDARPVFTEDAYALERYAFELVAPYHFESGAAGTDAHTVSPGLGYGLLPNLQVGLELPLSALHQDTGTRWGLAGLELLALYNFNTESAGLPALGLRADLQLPVGALAGDVARLTVRAIATRSFGRTRLHLNAARSVGSEDGLSPVDAAPRWTYSAAVDHSLLRSSLLLVLETAALRRIAGASMEVNVAAGLRWQWTPTVVLDAGVARRLRRAAGPDLALTLGLTHVFAVPGLMPSRPTAGGAAL